MSKNLNCLIGLTNSDNLVIFKFRNSQVDVKTILPIIQKTRMLANLF